MAIHKVVQYPDPVLIQPTAPVESIGEEERVLVQDMIETMHAERGVGLAANQIGISKQIFVASDDGVKGKELAFFNPKIIKRSGKLREFEGCLSVHDVYDSAIRYKNVTLRALNLDGEMVEVEATGLLSRIFQHEVDHLNGMIFVQRLSWFKKRKLMKQLMKRPIRSKSK